MRLAQTQMIVQLQIWKHGKIIPPRLDDGRQTMVNGLSSIACEAWEIFPTLRAKTFLEENYVSQIIKLFQVAGTSERGGCHLKTSKHE